MISAVVLYTDVRKDDISPDIQYQKVASTTPKVTTTLKPKEETIVRNASKPKQDTSCIDGYKNIQDDDYANGEVIVGFTPSVSFEGAKKVVATYGLTFKEGIRYIDNLHVNVPQGREIEWVCKLKTDPNIAYTQLNYFSNLQ